MTARRAVFFDRDGTLIKDVPYLKDPGEVVLIPGAAEAIKRLNTADIKAVIITNQSGVGRGFYSDTDVRDVNNRLGELLRLEGARLDGIYYCPHRPDEACQCRKPSGGLVITAAEELSIDIHGSYVVGDKVSDMELAARVGAKGVLVLTGMGIEERERLLSSPAHIAGDAAEAVAWIMEDF